MCSIRSLCGISFAPTFYVNSVTRRSLDVAAAAAVTTSLIYFVFFGGAAWVCVSVYMTQRSALGKCGIVTESLAFDLFKFERMKKKIRWCQLTRNKKCIHGRIK